MAAKKSTTEAKTTVEEKVVPAQAEEVKVAKRTIIANEPVAFRKTMSLETKYIMGQMPIGVAHEIVKETSSKIYGDFYLLNNGYYITKNGNYTIN